MAQHHHEQLFSAVVRCAGESTIRALMNDIKVDFCFRVLDSIGCRGGINLEYPLDPAYDVDHVLPLLETIVACGRCVVCHSEDALSDSGNCEVYQVNLLHLAAMYGHTWLVREMLSRGVEVNSATECLFHTPLHCAALSYVTGASSSVAKALVDAGADVNARDAKRNTPLHMTMQSHLRDLAEVLIEHGCCVNAANAAGETALLMAVRIRDVEMTRTLVAAGADVNIADDKTVLPLVVATRYKSSELVEALLASDTCDPDRQGRAVAEQDLMYPLYYAAYQENMTVVEMLLKKGANVDCRDKRRNTPLLASTYLNNLDLAKALIRYGANPNLTNDHGYSPLHHAAWEGCSDVSQVMLEAGAEHDLRTDDKNTPLALACHGNHPETAALLLKRHCDVNNSDKDGDTPLLYCAFNGCHSSVELLLDHGADPNQANKYRTTALWNAVYMKHPKIVTTLLRCNVNLSVASCGIDQQTQTPGVALLYGQPRTPLHVACDRGQFNTAKRLVLAGVDLRQEGWFWGGHGGLPHTLLRDPPMLHWLTQEFTNPPPLLRICRARVRLELGLDLQDKVEELEIPSVLKHYIVITSDNEF